MNASAYCALVGVDFAAGECDCGTVDVDATSALPNKGGTSVKNEHPIGAMGQGMVMCLVVSCRAHSRCCVGVDQARLEGHNASPDVDATSTLPIKGIT